MGVSTGVFVVVRGVTSLPVSHYVNSTGTFTTKVDFCPAAVFTLNIRNSYQLITSLTTVVCSFTVEVFAPCTTCPCKVGKFWDWRSITTWC